MPQDYINQPSAALVDALEALIEQRPDLQILQVKAALKKFKAVCQIPPVIVDYVRHKTDPNSPDAGFTKSQLELLMLGVIARSSSTYGTIPGLAADLAVIGEHSAAAVINDNAQNETGDSRHRPHPSLLFDSFEVLGQATGTSYLTPASYQLVRQIYRLREERNNPTFSNKMEINRLLDEQHIHIPHHTKSDLDIALHFCSLTDGKIANYHTDILCAVRRMDDTGQSVPGNRNPHDKRWQALQALELALREASSVDEHDTGKLSYIGAWGLAVDSMLGYAPLDNQEKALAWTQAHNDDDAGQAVGWQGAAEEGHAKDARNHALRMMSGLGAQEFADTLSQVARLGERRLTYWENLVRDMRAKENDGPKIALKKAEAFMPGHFPAKAVKKWANRASWAASLGLAGVLLAGGAREIRNENKKLNALRTEGTAQLVIPLSPALPFGGDGNAYAEAPRDRTVIEVPNGLLRLLQTKSEDLQDPETVALAAHGTKLRKSKGVIDPNQVVFSYIEDNRLVEVKPDNFEISIRHLQYSLTRPHTVLSPASGQGVHLR